MCWTLSCHIHLQISHRPSVSLPSIYHNIADYAAPSYTRLPSTPPLSSLPSLPMMHHTSHPIPLPLLDQWSTSWPDVPHFVAKPDPSWFTYPSNPCPPCRRPYPRLEQTAGSLSTSRPLQPHSHSYSSRARARPLRAQVPPALSALPALPISLPIPALERESCVTVLGSGLHLTWLLKHRTSPPRIPDRRCQRLHPSPLRRSFSMWCAMRHYWHPSRFHIDHPHFLTVLNSPTQTRISLTRHTHARARSESAHEMDRTTPMSLPFLSDVLLRLSSAASTVSDLSAAFQSDLAPA